MIWGMDATPQELADDAGTLVLESCHSTWHIDTARQRFRRVLRGRELTPEGVATAWRPYFDLELDPGSDSFALVLNPEGTRMLRSWRHTGAHCPHCEVDATAEMALDALRGALRR